LRGASDLVPRPDRLTTVVEPADGDQRQRSRWEGYGNASTIEDLIAQLERMEIDLMARLKDMEPHFYGQLAALKKRIEGIDQRAGEALAQVGPVERGYDAVAKGVLGIVGERIGANEQRINELEFRILQMEKRMR